MLKMERGAARAAGRNTRVVDMEELKRARERRASSARYLHEKDGEYEGVCRREIRNDSRFETRAGARGEAGTRQREAGPRRDQPAERPRPAADDRPFWERDDPFEDPDKPFWKQDRPFRGMEEEPEEPRESRKPPRQPREQARQEDRRRQPPRQPQYRSAEHQRPAQAQTGRKAGNTGLKLLFVLLGLLAVMVVVGLKVFEIREIEVKGAETMTAESVIALSGISRGDNILKVSLGQARENLESDPLVEVLGISRAFPDRIMIEIRQRKPHGAIAWLGGYAVIDENGLTLDVRDSLPVGQYPLVTGVDIEPAERGKPVAGVNAGTMEVLKRLLTALDANKALALVSEINMADAGKLMLMTGEGLSIDLGKPENLDKKAWWIACAVPGLRERGYTSGVLHITGLADPIYSSGGSAAGNQPEADGEQQDAEGTAGENGPDNAA